MKCPYCQNEINVKTERDTNFTPKQIINLILSIVAIGIMFTSIMFNLCEQGTWSIGSGFDMLGRDYELSSGGKNALSSFIVFIKVTSVMIIFATVICTVVWFMCAFKEKDKINKIVFYIIICCCVLTLIYFTNGIYTRYLLNEKAEIFSWERDGVKVLAYIPFVIEVALLNVAIILKFIKSKKNKIN